MDQVTAAVEALEAKRWLTRGVAAGHVAVYAAALFQFWFTAGKT